MLEVEWWWKREWMQSTSPGGVSNWCHPAADLLAPLSFTSSFHSDDKKKHPSELVSQRFIFTISICKPTQTLAGQCLIMTRQSQLSGILCQKSWSRKTVQPKGDWCKTWWWCTGSVIVNVIGGSNGCGLFDRKINTIVKRRHKHNHRKPSCAEIHILKYGWVLQTCRLKDLSMKCSSNCSFIHWYFAVQMITTKSHGQTTDENCSNLTH